MEPSLGSGEGEEKVRLLRPGADGKIKSLRVDIHAGNVILWGR